MSPRPRTEEEGNRARGSANTVVLTDGTLQRMAPSRRWLCTATVVAMFAVALGGSVSAEDGAVRPAAETLWKMDPRIGQWVEANDLTWVRGYDREGRPLKDIKPEDYVTGNDLFPRRARDRYASAAPALADVSSPSRRETHQHPRRDATREGVPGGYPDVAPAGRLAEEGAQPAAAHTCPSDSVSLGASGAVYLFYADRAGAAEPGRGRGRGDAGERGRGQGQLVQAHMGGDTFWMLGKVRPPARAAGLSLCAAHNGGAILGKDADVVLCVDGRGQLLQWVPPANVAEGGGGESRGGAGTGGGDGASTGNVTGAALRYACTPSSDKYASRACMHACMHADEYESVSRYIHT